MAIAGVLGDVIGIRWVFGAASLLVLAAAVVSWVMFRGVSPRTGQAAAAHKVEAEAA